MSSISNSAASVGDLRQRWQPTKERLNRERDSHPTAVRFHRTCSWLDQAQKLIEAEEFDLALINQWIAFNALYGQWDDTRNDPYPDRESWQQFCARLLVLDENEIIGETLREHKRLVMSLLEDEYLSGYFWKDPTEKRARQSKKGMYDARTWYLENRWSLILERSLERVYLMRCQLVHGASTHGGKLNRAALKRCVMMLDRLLPALLTVVIEHGGDEDWGLLCYPPLHK